MWSDIIQMLLDSVTSAFGWFNDILNTDNNIWPTVYFVIASIFALRFILGPILGFQFESRAEQLFGGRSDRVKKLKGLLVQKVRPEKIG